MKGDRKELGRGRGGSKSSLPHPQDGTRLLFA